MSGRFRLSVDRAPVFLAKVLISGLGEGRNSVIRVFARLLAAAKIGSPADTHSRSVSKNNSNNQNCSYFKPQVILRLFYLQQKTARRRFVFSVVFLRREAKK